MHLHRTLIIPWSKLCSVHKYFQAGGSKGLKMKDFILPGTRKLACDRTGCSLAWPCTHPFKIHCSILLARQPSCAYT